MRFRRRAFGRRGSKRSVAWISGVTGMDPVARADHKLLALAPLTTGASVQAAAIQLTADTDLSLHGGEDAVIERIRGRLCLYGGSLNSGAGLVAADFFVRVLIVQSDVTPAGFTMPQDFTTSAGLGADDILWMRDVFVPRSTAVGTAGAPFDTLANEFMEIDVRAKRKLQSDRQLILWVQTQQAGAVIAAQLLYAGGIRMLLKRPR